MSFVDGKYCLTCSCQTIERTRYNPVKNNGDYQISTEGLECSLCKCLICKDCISELSEEINPKKNLSKYHPDTYPFLEGVIDYNAGIPLRNSYIGHCCIISMHYERRTAPTTSPSSPITKRKKKSSSVRLGGAFVLPEFALILPTVESIPDVFSLGRDASHKEKWHFVLDEQFVEQHLHDAAPSTSLPSTWTVVRGLTFKLSQPHNLEGKPSRKPVSSLASFSSSYFFTSANKSCIRQKSIFSMCHRVMIALIWSRIEGIRTDFLILTSIEWSILIILNIPMIVM